MKNISTSLETAYEGLKEEVMIREFLLDWLKGFIIDRDDVDWLIREILRQPKMFTIFMNNIRAEDRVKDKMDFAKNGRGNFAVEIIGLQRHGKSTLGRSLVKERERIQGSERIVVYARSNSEMSKAVEETAKQIYQQVLESGLEEWTDPFLDACEMEVGHYTFFMDEREKEHEKGSRKAVNDMNNLIDTTAKTGCDWILISPSLQPQYNTYCLLRVLGYNEESKETLALYYDRYRVCQGYVLYPQVEESDEYDREKSRGMVEILLTGGRKRAIDKQLEKKMGEIQRFYGDMDLREAMEKELEKLGMDQSVTYLIFYFFDSFEGTKDDNPDYQKTAQFFNKNYKTVYGGINRVLEEWTNVERGAFFEKYLEEKFSFYLKKREEKEQETRKPTMVSPSSTLPPLLSVERDGRQGFPDLILGYEDGSSVPVNAKLHVMSDRTNTMPRSEFGPEIESASSCFDVIYYNLYYHWDAPKRYRLPVEGGWDHFTVNKGGEGYLSGVKVEEVPLFDGLDEVYVPECDEEDLLEVVV